MSDEKIYNIIIKEFCKHATYFPNFFLVLISDVTIAHVGHLFKMLHSFPPSFLFQTLYMLESLFVIVQSNSYQHPLIFEHLVTK